jgi:hypothetical protein
MRNATRRAQGEQSKFRAFCKRRGLLSILKENRYSTGAGASHEPSRRALQARRRIPERNFKRGARGGNHARDAEAGEEIEQTAA